MKEKKWHLKKTAEYPRSNTVVAACGKTIKTMNWFYFPKYLVQDINELNCKTCTAIAQKMIAKGETRVSG
jgi:hypothetical protein